MLGKLISKILKDKKITPSELARKTDINVGHLIHIEKEDRMPSHKALKKICDAIDIPYQQMLYTLDKIDENTENEEYKTIDHISYATIPAFNSLEDLINCPAKFGTCSFAVKVNDDSMEPLLLQGSYAFVEQNTPLKSKDIGLFYINNKFYFRRFFIHQNSIILKSNNEKYNAISINKSDEFIIVGKVIGTNDEY